MAEPRSEEPVEDTPPRARRPPGEARAQLIESARRCFREQGFRNTSTRDIADRAEVAEGLIFRYFGSKRELFQETIVRPFASEVVQHLGIASEPWVDFTTGLFEILRRRRPDLIAILNADAFEDGVVDLSSDSVLTQLAETMQRLVEDGVKTYGWSGVDGYVQSRVILATILGLAAFDGWLFTDPDRRPETPRLTRDMLALIERGLAHQPQRPRPGD